MYYGCPPTLVERIEPFMNSEKQKCFETAPKDFTRDTPVSNNSPFVNVLLGDTYKVRAILDTGSTNTIMSHGLYKLLSGLRLVPTSSGFRGVNAGAQYVGIIEALNMKFSDKLEATLNVGVIPTEDVFLLVGSECIGGQFAKLTRLA